MRIKGKALSIAWKVVLLAFGAWGLLDGAGILAGQYQSGFPHMFTNVSNLFAWGYFACAVAWLARHRDEGEATPLSPVPSAWRRPAPQWSSPSPRSGTGCLEPIV